MTQTTPNLHGPHCYDDGTLMCGWPDKHQVRGRIVLHPGAVYSRTDGDRHYIPAGRLAELYGVDLRYCVIAEHGYFERAADIHLYPRFDGDYRLPDGLEWARR